MRVLVFGLRAFPGVQGGVEVHAENLYPQLVEMGCDVDVIMRTQYMPVGAGETWRGVRFHSLWAPRAKVLEAFIHSFLGLCVAAVRRPDLVHIHAIGPGLFTPLARLLGLKVVVTHHGPNYEHGKWGSAARHILKMGERVSMRWANERIAVSRPIADMVRRKYGVQAHVIENGVVVSEIPETEDELRRLGLERRKYVLHVGRLVSEKRHMDLMRAFRMADLKGWKLVLVGGADNPDEYSEAVTKAAGSTPDVIATGPRVGMALRELFAHAGIFAYPSSNEGHPIALLEALSYGLPVIASDIAANLELGLPEKQYFRMGDIDMLAARLKEMGAAPFSPDERERIRQWVGSRYDWHEIAKQTLEVYRAVLGLAPAAAVRDGATADRG